MRTIDGSQGEGGGQVLRTSLALSLVTGEPFRMLNVRARRAKPGLMRQHLTAVEAAQAVSEAQVTGASPGGREISFRPGRVQGGSYFFSVGTAGSATLVLQTILPALFLAEKPSHLILEGGTHNPKAPPFDFLARAFLPVVARMGPRVDALLERPGFFPAGGGRMRVDVVPARALERIDLLERGAIRSRRAKAVVAALPVSIAEREVAVLAERLGWDRSLLRTETIRNPRGPGNVVLVEVESENVTEVFTAFGERGVPAETVAGRAASETLEYLEAGVPVGAHLADQILLPFALAGGGAYRTLAPTLHTRTQAEILRVFLGSETRMTETGENDWRVEIGSGAVRHHFQP
jgi:RNA 3'-terminal phosphate cyclase (ATP)